MHTPTPGGFAELGIPPAVVHALTARGITAPFPIQAAAIPDALHGRDLLGRGPTGSGKTLTFGLPMLVRLAGAPTTPGRPRGLVLVPTRELALQVEESLVDPAAALGLRVGAVIGGVAISRHRRLLSRPVDLLVATPGRAQDLIDQGDLHLDAVSVTALDEADHMADMGFLPQVRRLLDRTPRGGQRLLFSATLDGDVQTLVRRYLHDPVEHSTAPAAAAVDTMTHHLLYVADVTAKRELAARIAARDGRTILFVRTKHGVDRLAKQLRRVGVAVGALHGGKAQGNRTRTLAAFSSGEVPVLACTDVAARGIHVDDVSLVVHLDPPADPKDYLHRAGRTARAGEAGAVLTLVLPEQRREVDDLMRRAGVEPRVHDVLADAAVVARLTGMREPSGTPVAPGAPGGPPAPQPRPARTRPAQAEPNRQGRAEGAYRGGRSGSSAGRRSGSPGTDAPGGASRPHRPKRSRGPR